MSQLLYSHSIALCGRCWQALDDDFHPCFIFKYTLITWKQNCWKARRVDQNWN